MHEVSTLSVEELEDRFKRLYTALELTVKAITSYAQATQYSHPQSTSVAGLEHRFTTLWNALDVTVAAITSYAEVAQYSQQHYSTLADGARGMLHVLQAITSDQNITPEWVAQRDALIAQTRTLIDEQGMGADDREDT